MKNLVPKWLQKLITGSLFIGVAIVLLSAVSYSMFSGAFGISIIFYGFAGSASLVSGMMIAINSATDIANDKEGNEDLLIKGGRDELTDEEKKYMADLFRRSEDIELTASQ